MLKTEAIVLRSMRYGEADRILHVYTPHRGRLSAIAKGVRRSRSRFGGRLEPFFRLNLVLYEGRSDLLTVTSAETIAGHPRLREDAGALDGARLGLIDNWLRHVQDVQDRYAEAIDAEADASARLDRLCELNVIEQVANVCHTTIAREAWERGQPLAVHGWIYGIQDGRLKDLDVTVSDFGEARKVYQTAIRALNPNP